METTSDLKALGTRIGTAMAEADWLTVLSHLSPGVIAHVPAVGDFTGAEELAGFLADTSSKTSNGEHFELLDTLVGDRFVGLYFRITAERSGRPPLDNLTVHLARLDEDDLVSEIWFHNFDTRAVAGFWA